MLKVLKMTPGIAAVLRVFIDDPRFEEGYYAHVIHMGEGRTPLVDFTTAYILTGKFQQEIPIDKVFGPDDVAKIVKHFEAVFALPIGQRQAYLELVRGDWK